MDQQLKSNLTSKEHWVRLLYMMIFVLFSYIAAFVMMTVVVVQFLFALITGSDNRKLRGFGDSLSKFIWQTLQFLTYNSEDKPFPFADWPEPEASVSEGEVLLASEPDEVEAPVAEESPVEQPAKATTKPVEEDAPA